jgi:hypothetical protein
MPSIFLLLLLFSGQKKKKKHKPRDSQTKMASVAFNNIVFSGEHV